MIITPLCQRVIVRYARKPFWMPTARSKLFRIAELNFYSPLEIEQISSLHEAYRAQMSSINEFMRHEFYIPATQSGGLPAEFVKNEIGRDEQIYEENRQVNARVAKMKEKLMENRTRELEERLLEEKLVIEDRLMSAAQRVDEYIIGQKSDPDSFINRENIETMIAGAMENPVSFEFCIDKSGRKYGLNVLDKKGPKR